MLFTWDEVKAERNFIKHEVSFEETKTIFSDPYFIDFFDPDHSDDEDRYIIVGMSVSQRILIASYTERQGRIRLISARKATRKERQLYEEQ